MKRLSLILIALFFLMNVWCIQALNGSEIGFGQIIKLPQPKFDGGISIEKALKERRSIRTYKPVPLSVETVSQLLWAAQGISEPSKGLRTAPSAEASYLVEVYLITGDIIGIAPGMYKYQPRGHEIKQISQGDIKERLYNVVGQAPIKNAAALLVFTGYPKRSVNPGWMYLEVGHAAQNVLLQSVSLDLGAVVMAGFRPEEVKKVLGLPDDELPIYILPVGKRM